jgi:nucleoside-diphosphate-sugar epimerase
VAVNPPGADDVAEVILDPSATNKVFGWSAQVSFEETIKKMLRWYDVHGITDVYSHLQEKK